MSSASGPGSGSPQLLVEVRQLGGAVRVPLRGADAFCQRSAAYSLLAVGVPFIPGVVDHAATVTKAMDAWVTRGMLPNVAPSASGAGACDDRPTLDRLRRAVRAYDPSGVMSLGRALGH